MPEVVTELRWSTRHQGEQSRPVHRFLPVDWDLPTNVHEALVASKALLLEDRERWVQGTLYRLEEQVDPDTPFCDSWGVCAMGAVAIVTVGLYKSDRDAGPGSPWLGWQVSQFVPGNDAMDALFHEACLALHLATQQLYNREAVYQLNDHVECTFDMIINVFNRALENTSDLQDDNEEAPVA